MNKEKDNKLGQITKPKAEMFMTKRKLYIVRLVGSTQHTPEEYEALCREYWREVDEHLSQLETRVGTVAKVFAEGITGKGEDARVSLERSNALAWIMVKPRLETGAAFEQLEDTELLLQMIDWGRCLDAPFASRKVAEKIHSFFTEVTSKRASFHIDALNKGINGTEAALLLTTSPDINLPKNIERFVISPPSLDKLERWMREEMERVQREMKNQQTKEDQQVNADTKTRQERRSTKRTESGLWIPD